MKTRFFAIACSIGMAALYFTASVSAQSTFGTILGTVTDASGAVIPNVVVKITNQEENISHEYRTDAQGNYQAENLKADTYTISVQASGFKEVTIKNVLLTARQIVRTDLKLAMGTATENVTVEANAELINTESQTIDTSITSTEVLNLPANYRGAGSTSPFNLLAFLPGVTGDDNGNIGVQGAATNQVEYSVDGISTTSVRYAGPQKEMFPSVESISEMKVQGSGGGAEFGNPADITTTSKSGSNVFHGSAFEYLQNAALDAKQWTIFQVSKAPKSANTFGGSIGGPLFGKRTFFFGDYEAMRYRTAELRTGTVPSQSMRNGDFSSFLGPQTGVDAKGRPVFQNEIFDPNTSVVESGGTMTPDGFGFDPTTGLPIAGQANIIPSGRFDSRVAAILPYYPLPNQGGVDNYSPNNWVVNTPNPILSDQFDIRIDHTINSKQAVFGRWTYKNQRQINPSNLILPEESDFEHDNQIVLAHNYTITPNLVNELRGGISRSQHGGSFAINGPAFMQSLGLNSNQLGPFPPGGFPDFVFEPRTTLSNVVHTRPDPLLSHNLQINENLTWTRGRHTIKSGVDFRMLHVITAWYSGVSEADDYGDFFFNGQYTGQYGQEDAAFGDFLLGIPYYSYVTHTPPRNIDGTAKHYFLYAADTFRATQKLTLDYGLRVTRIPGLYDPINFTNFDPSTPAVPATAGDPGKSAGRVIISSDPRSLAATQPLWATAVNACTDNVSIPGYAGPDGINPCTPFMTSQQAGWPKQLRNVYTHFSPRVGFAYRPFGDNKTVVRGGIGIYEVTTLGAVFFSIAGIHDGFQGSFSNTTICDSGSASGTCTPNADFYRFPDVKSPNPLNTGYGTQGFYTANQRDKKDPYTIQWNLSIERTLHGNTAMRVSYIANRADQLTWTPHLNQPPILANGQVGPKPFPAWSDIRSRNAGAFSTYQSMQAELIHKYSNGLTFQSTWTYAKNLADNESWPRSGFDGEISGDTMNRFDLRGDYGNSNGSHKHRWITTMVDELPIGKGRPLLGNADGVLNGIVGGWRLSTILLVQSGPYDTPFISFDSSGNGIFGGWNRPDVSGNPNNFHHTRTLWWNPDVYACPGGVAGQDFFPDGLTLNCTNVIGRFGNARVGSLVGPPTFNLSLGLAKVFQLTERAKLKFESSFTNIPNHINLDDPRQNLTETGTFGQVQGARTGDAGGNRVGQFALRIEF